MQSLWWTTCYRSMYREKISGGGESKESGSKKTLKDLANYFKKAAKHMEKEVVPGMKYLKEHEEKIYRYEDLARELLSGQAGVGSDPEMHKTILNDAILELEMNYATALGKGSKDGGKELGFEKDEVAQLIDFLRNELGEKSMGMSEEDIKEGQERIKGFTINGKK